MKYSFLKLSPLALIMIITLALSTIMSCSKTTDPNAEFLGTYAGSQVITGVGTTYADTVILSAGTTSSAVTILEKRQGVVANGTVNSNTLTIATQTVAVSGGSYPISGTGSLNGSTLTVNWSEQINGVTVNSVFTGTK